MSEWRECKLGDVANIQTGPFGSQLHSSDYVEVGIPSIMPTNIGTRLNINRNNIACITETDAQRLKKYRVLDGDIVYSRRGDVEKCAFITKKESGWLCGTGCIRIRFSSDKISPKFCAYYLSTEESKGWVSGNAVGTTMPNLNSTILEQVPLSFPPLPEQRAIADVLSSLDDKIDLLHRQNKTLESLAETLFRQWFVEEAQEDWEEKRLYDVIDLVGGGTPKTSMPQYWEGDINWLSGSDITSNHKSYVLSSDKKITALGLKHSSTKLLPKHAMVITARGTVGKYTILSEAMAFSQTNYGIKPKYKDCYFFTYLLVSYCVNELQAVAYGTIFDTITTNTFKEHTVLLPSEIKIIRFEKEVAPIFEKMLQNKKQIRTLEDLRDTLLPKLMSGEVRVRL